MSKIIQIHTLTSHSTHNLNRDDLGQPKTVEFLGETHGRISSQCLKRAIRNSMKSELQGQLGIRTRKLPKLVKDHLIENHISEELAKIMTQEIASLAKKDKASEGSEETQLIFLTNQELSDIKYEALKICQENEGSKITEKTKKEMEKSIKELYKNRKFRDSVDIAMFGRMTTSKVFEDCDAAVQVSHAMTTHAIKNQDDFFTAVDDLGEDTGAGHMDEKSYSTGIFYKYATINFNLLTNNLKDDKQLAKSSTLTFCKSFITAIPTGSQNAMAAHQHPFLILITIGKGANSNLANAFIDVDRKKQNPIKVTAQALINEFNSEQKFYGDIKKVDHAFLASLKSEFLLDDNGKQIDLENIDLSADLQGIFEKMESVL